MSRRPRHAGGQGGIPLRAWIIGTAAVMILAVLGGTGVYLNFSKRSTDRATGCPTDRYDSVTIALVDLTDPINPTQAAALRNALLKIRNEVPKFGRLEIYPLKPTTMTTIEPLFGGCSPGSGREVDSRFYGNPELADRLWTKLFASNVNTVIGQLSSLSPQDNSPLLEAIQSVAVTAFGTPIAENAADKRIIVFSDMIHHTPQMSMYQGAPAFERFKKEQYYLRVKPTLRGANVDVYLIVRETRKNVQQPPLYKFWLEHAADAGGYLRKWEPLQ